MNKKLINIAENNFKIEERREKMVWVILVIVYIFY